MKASKLGKKTTAALLAILLAAGPVWQSVPSAVAAGTGGTYFTDTDNWGGGAANTAADGDLDYNSGGRIDNGHGLYPIETKILNVDRAPQNNVYLLVRAYDVDEYDGKSGTGEWDRVYLSADPTTIQLGDRGRSWPTDRGWNKATSNYKKEFPQSAYIGALSGNDETWNTTVLKVDKSVIKSNKDYYAGVSIHDYVNSKYNFNPNWVVEVDWMQLVIDGGEKVSGAIDKSDIAIKKGEITVDTSFVPNTNGNFSMEVSVVKPAANDTEVDQNLDTKKKLFSGAKTNERQTWDDVQLTDTSIDPSKEYDVNVILFEDRGGGSGDGDTTNPGKAQHIYTVSTFDPKLTNFSETLTQYDPTVLNPDNFKSHYMKINGAANGANLNKVRIDTLPDPAKGRLVLNNGTDTPTEVTVGSEIPAADLEKLTFVPAAQGFSGSASFTWNGYDDDEYAVYPGTVTLTANAAPQVDAIPIAADKGDVVSLPQSLFQEAYSDSASEQLSRVRIQSLPDGSTGKLVLENNGTSTEVQAGDELSGSNLTKLKFVPASGFTGTAEFEWNGYDGAQYAREGAKVTIRVNAPPTAGMINKSGATGQKVTFSRSDFALAPAYEDAENDALTKIRIGLPANFSEEQGMLSYETVTGSVYLTDGAPNEIDANLLDTLTFKPSSNLPNGGTASFSWEAYDGRLYSETPGQAVLAYNGMPSADAVGANAEEGTLSLPITLIGNDPETVSGLVYGVTNAPAKGALTPADPSDPNGSVWIYTPDAEFAFGTDTFTYTVTDEDGQESAPATVTIRIDRTLDGWTGDKQQGDASVVKSIPGQALKLSAVSSLLADEVTANVNGVPVTLTLANSSTYAQEGYKLWEKSTFLLPNPTSAGKYTVTYTASAVESPPLPSEPLSRMGDNDFEILKIDLSLTAEPEAIIGDGVSKTELTAILKDADGNPVPGIEVAFDSDDIGSFPNGDRALTDTNGKAVVTYQSGTMTGLTEQSVPVIATVNDPSHGLWRQKEIRVVFLPAAIKGVLTEGKNNARVAGASVRITLDIDGDGVIEPGVDFDQTITTGADGAYYVPVPLGGREYTLTVTRNIVVGGVPTPVTYEQKAQVGAAGVTEDEVYDSQKTAAGVVLFKQPDGSTSLVDNAFVAHTSVYLKDASGHYVTENGAPKAFALGAKGVFSAPGLTIGDYALEIRYELKPGKEITIGTSTVHVQANGEMNISQELVDPYGTIRDASTKALIEGATVTLYYADTTKNRTNSVVPNTKVTLPAIPGFAPNDNASPVQLSDVNGFYAYMVYPETDYYLVVTKNGYLAYTSPMISVGQEIVRHDLELTPIPASVPANVSTPAPVTAQPKLELKLTVDRNPVKENEQTTLTVDYQNISSVLLGEGTIRVTLPVGAEVVDNDGGTLQGRDLSWKIHNLSGGESGSFKVTLKWSLQNGPEKRYPVTGSFIGTAAQSSVEAKAQSVVSIQVMSDRFEDLQHQRYILGYPDGLFKADRSLTRAELAAIVARLTENVDLDDPLPFRDVPSDHWAANYIRIAVKHGYFSGFQDGTFRPDSKVSRAELAAVTVRFLGLQPSASRDSSFSDVSNTWAAASIERLHADGLINGYPDGKFLPGNLIKRSEAVTMLNRMLTRGPLNGLTQQFPDIPATHWAFGDVQEATVSHTSKRSDSGEVWTGTLEDQVQ
ncbi:S-layer homology domain-containing protein [Saccharibacillus sacchari]|uniref:S-layer homology domain-containing protein n=1 Tax=Saccharibacillus sacchari TaxID=456493 RepID=UPI0004B7DD07|nr:S-layer homology domain-containing protein [Saccharibacillus sacchari]